MRRDRVEFIQAVKTLADVVGLQLPKGDLTRRATKNIKTRLHYWRTVIAILFTV
jgi:hypothetical protein